MHPEELLGVISLKLGQVHSPGAVGGRGGIELGPAPGLAALLHADLLDGDQELAEVPDSEAVVADEQAKVKLLLAAGGPAGLLAWGRGRRLGAGPGRRCGRGCRPGRRRGGCLAVACAGSRQQQQGHKESEEFESCYCPELEHMHRFIPISPSRKELRDQHLMGDVTEVLLEKLKLVTVPDGSGQPWPCELAVELQKRTALPK